MLAIRSFFLRKSNYNYKLKLYKYYIHTFQKIKKLNQMTNTYNNISTFMQCSSSWTSIKHNQTSTNDSECSGTTGLQRAHVTPLFVSLHWLPVAARIQFKTLMLAYRTTTGSTPTYFHSLLRIYIPSRSLRSASERRLVVPSQRGSKSLSRTFSFTVPGRWNDLPTPIRNAGSLSIFKQQLKTHLFQHYLTT